MIEPFGSKETHVSSGTSPHSEQCTCLLPGTALLLGPPVASTGMLMRKAALARDLRGFMGGARCGCGACAGGATSGSGARLGRALGMGSGLPDTLLGAPWASLGAMGAGMADCLRRGTLDGAAVGLSHGATPARFRMTQEHGEVLSAGHSVWRDSVMYMPIRGMTIKGTWVQGCGTCSASL